MTGEVPSWTVIEPIITGDGADVKGPVDLVKLCAGVLEHVEMVRLLEVEIRASLTHAVAEWYRSKSLPQYGDHGSEYDEHALR